MANSQIYKNIGASVLPQIVNIVSNLVLPSLIISIYGSQVNGLISTIKSIVGYVSLVGAGISIAATQSLYAPVAQGDTIKVKGLLKAASKMFNRSAYVYMVILLGVAIVYPTIIISDIPYYLIAILVVVVGLSGVSEFAIVGVCRSLLFADRKVYVCSIIQAISLLLSLICAVILLEYEVSIIWVQLALSLVYISRAIFIRLYVNKHYVGFWYDKTTKPNNMAVEKRSDAMIHQLTGLAVWSSQTIILSIMVSLEAASMYAVYNIVFSGLMSICTNINSAITPFIGRTLAIEPLENIRNKYDIVEYGSHVLFSFIFMVTSVMISPFVQLYTIGADMNYENHLFALLFTVVYVFNIKRLPNNSLINAAGHFKETRNRALVEAVICIVGSVCFTIVCGVYGVLCGTLCAIGWRCIDIIMYSNKKILKSAASKSIMRLVRTFLMILLIYWISYDIVKMHMQSYVEWIFYAIICSVCSLIIILFDGMLLDMSTMKTLVKKIVHK